MLYHALALADAGADVTLVGRAETPLPSDVRGHGAIRVEPLPARADRGGIGRQAGRWLVEAARLAGAVVRTAPDLVLVQAPPLFPAAFAALVASRCCGARFVVDWHNLGDGLLALRPRGAGAPAAFLAALERTLGRGADGHLAVSEELAAALPSRRDVFGARVFRDRPHGRFASPSAAEVSAFRATLLSSLGLPFGEPLLLALSPTSWGRDEDLFQLLAAVPLVEAALPREARPVLLIASGSGEGREAFEERARTLPPGRVAVRTVCVPGDDYPLLVRSADAGISLHRPAAGLDPPMKVADLLGGGAPVLELDAGPAPSSLVVPGRNGLRFADAAGLAAQLSRLASHADLLRALREGAAGSLRPGFAAAWRAEAAPLLLGRSA